jgi:hypothetical protein
MKRSALRKIALPLLAVGVLVGAVAAADAAMVRFGNIVLRADGGFAPRQLPKRAFAPIHFQGYADISSIRGGPPPALERAVLDFDRDGRLFTNGLPICPPSRIEGLSPLSARAKCKGAIVGEGRLGAAVALNGGTARVTSLLTLFNGPRQDGNATVVLHAQAPPPVSETYVVVVPVERRGGGYAYRATIEVPPIAGGAGVLTHIDAKIGREYRYRGTTRSYTSARCSDGILETHGYFRFAGGIPISGDVFRACTAIR